MWFVSGQPVTCATGFCLLNHRLTFPAHSWPRAHWVCLCSQMMNFTKVASLFGSGKPGVWK